MKVLKASKSAGPASCNPDVSNGCNRLSGAPETVPVTPLLLVLLLVSVATAVAASAKQRPLSEATGWSCCLTQSKK